MTYWFVILSIFSAPVCTFLLFVGLVYLAFSGSHRERVVGCSMTIIGVTGLILGIGYIFNLLPWM